MVPNIVALEIVLSGLSTLLEGIVAHSNPRKAKKVKVAEAVIAEKKVPPLALNGIKFFNWKKNNPAIATKMSGITFNIVVTNCNLPEANMPFVFIQVRNQIATKPAATATIALLPRMGKKVLMALTNETAIAALVHQSDIQYPQATKKPAKSPKPF